MFRRAAALLVLLLAAAAVWNYFRPVPAVAATAALPSQSTVPGDAPTLPWPQAGSAAVAVSGLGLVATSGNEAPTPMASVTKVMTALIVLEDKPLKKGETGPSITVTSTDVQSYQAEKADQQSVVEVRAGEQLTEFEALQALLIPSGNNIGDLLARWDLGSVDQLVAKMNQRAKSLHMSHTTFADTYGVSTRTVSTPSDLVALGMAAMQQDVIAQIVNLPQANLPVAGIVYNVDYVLGQSGIIGIKTGSGVGPGASFLFASAVTVNARPLILYGCVMGQATLDDAFNSAKALIAAAQPVLKVVRVVTRNQALATYNTPWGDTSDLLATVDVDLVEWPGTVLRRRLDTPNLVVDQPLAAGSAEGSEHLVLGLYSLDVPLVTAAPIYPPGRFWKLTRLS